MPQYALDRYIAGNCNSKMQNIGTVASIRENYSPDICDSILNIVFDYSLHKFDDTMQLLNKGRPKFLSVIEHFVSANDPIEMCLPAFPFKSANKVYKALGTLPDKAEEIALDRLNVMCRRIGEMYSPGAILTIISDGLVYNDLLSISDRDTWAYGEALREMAQERRFDHIRFSRIRDLVDFTGPETLNEITYVACATDFRCQLLNQFGTKDLDVNYEIEHNKDTMMTYLGYCRFLSSDLEHIFPATSGRSKRSYKKDVKFVAQQMLLRGYAFAAAVRRAYPNHLRLSIHKSTGEHKICLSLLKTQSEYTTPWHCSVAQMADGTWLSGPKGEFELDPSLEIIYESSRPSHFQKKMQNTRHGAKVVAELHPTADILSISEKAKEAVACMH